MEEEIKKTEALKRLGNDPEAAIKRMLGDTGFYLRLVKRFIDSPDWKELSLAIEDGKTEEAYVAAHRMKGSAAELSLRSIFAKLSDMCEDLRNGDTKDLSMDFNFCRMEADKISFIFQQIPID